MLSFIFKVVRSIVIVSFRRVFKGPKREGWSITQEAVIRAMSLNARQISHMDTAKARARMEKLVAPKPYGAGEITTETTRVGSLPGAWLSPTAAQSPSPNVCLYFHGGGFVFGSILSYQELLNRITLAFGGRTLAVDYRLAPEHPFPAAVEDALEAYRWLVHEQGQPPEQILLAGDSSGGNLVLTTLLQLRDAGEPMPAAAALLSPWLDLTLEGESMLENARFSWGDKEYLERWVRDYLPPDAGKRTQPLISPGFSDLRGLPPLLVQFGDAELLASEVEAFVERAQEARVNVTSTRYPNCVHGFQAMANLFPQGIEAIEEIGSFAKQHLEQA